MTDLQFKAFLRSHMADLERVRAAGVSNAAAAEIDRIEARLQRSLDAAPTPELLDEDEEPNGLTDLQFGTWLASLAAELEHAAAASDKDTKAARLEGIIAELEKNKRDALA